MESERKMYIEVPVSVHGYDVDFMGIVNNTVYVKWLEDLRMAILDKYFPLTEMLKDDNSPILAETCIQYKRPITFGSHLTGKCWIWLTGRSRWVAEHVIEGDGKIYATADRQDTISISKVIVRCPSPNGSNKNTCTTNRDPIEIT